MVSTSLTREEAKEKNIQNLKILVEDFKANRDKYKSLSEADIETKLVEELFIGVLGWSKNDFEKQQNVRRGDKRGRADYAFKIGEKIVFFLEVKKVGIPLDGEADKQVVSYALSRKNVSFAISTNFEQMKIFCVEQDKAYNNVFRVFRTPDEYLTKMQDLLLLSKESFEKNELLKQAEVEQRLKKRITIDKMLLEDLMEIRKLIANDIEKRYPDKYNINEQDEIVQRIIDRLIFIRRAEDIGIQPDDLRLEDIKHLSGDKAYPKLKEIFKEYNSGYDSGLFDPNYDNDCDKILIDGEKIKKLIYLLYESKDGYIYNFDWIDADVLGQVYEQYLGKILAQTKSGKAKLKEGQAHRKEQGIYYTPTYIVDYIVKNTVGELLKDKKVNPTKIKILDPACGSGSFLIKAYDYLTEHIINKDDDSVQHRLDEQGHYSVKTEILKNNIYGVDLDQKAVEITKLNLLLKAAEKNRKLPKEVDLHIMHGNSLIDDESVAGSSAFRWEDDFKEGTFDVIIGNPPYIRIQALEEKDVNFFNSTYRAATKNYDIYALFVEKGFSLLKEGGFLGFILPSKFFNTDYGEGLRKVISDNKLLYKIVDFKDFQVFDGATTYTCLLFLKKGNNKKFEYLELSDKEDLPLSRTMLQFKFKKSNQEQPLGGDNWNFVSNDFKSIINKLNKVELRLKDFSDNIFQGIITGADKIFIVIKKDKSKFYSEQTNKDYQFEEELLHPLLKGSKHIRRYKIDNSEKYVIFPYRINGDKALPIEENELKSKYPLIHNYFLENKPSLQKRDGGKMKGDSWYLFSRNQNLTRFDKEKIMTPCIAKNPSFTFDSKKDFFFVGSGGGGGGAYGINLKDSSLNYSILAILNSKLTFFFIKQTSSEFSGGFYAFNRQYIENIPIVLPEKDIVERLSKLSKTQLEKNKLLTEFGNKNTSETAKLKEEIEKIDREIDELVYKIYGITEKEKQIIEESLK